MVKPNGRGQKGQQQNLDAVRIFCLFLRKKRDSNILRCLLRSRMGYPIQLVITHYFPTPITFANFEAQKMLCSANMS